MSTPHIIQTIIEFILIGLIIVGIIYEPLLVKWEEKQKEKIFKNFNERRNYRKWNTYY